MSSYNPREKSIASIFAKLPFIKRPLSRGYKYLNYLRYNRENSIIHEHVRCEPVVYDDKHGSFWGYYDKSPQCNENILYHSYPISQQKIRNISEINIVLNNQIISNTRAWNWQQGSMLSWLGRDGNKIIHNDFDGKKYISKVIDINRNSMTVINNPIYAVCKDGKRALSLDFTRLAKLRPDYGYFNLDTSNIDRYSADDGIFFIDLEQNKSSLLISFEDLVQIDHHPTMDGAWHKVNHMMISPDDRRFMFYHRWITEDGQKYTRLYTANLDGSDLYLLSDDGMVSHCCWRTNNEIIGYGQKPGIGERYFQYNDRSDRFSIIGEGKLVEDGHPSVSPDGKWLLTDTTDPTTMRDRKIKLLLFHLEREELVEIGSFVRSYRYMGEFRCDLHPRFSPDGRSLTVDSVHEGVRRLYRIEIDEMLAGL